MGFHQNSPETLGEANLRQATKLISELISLSHSSKVFTAKWQSIRTKLEELISGLTTAGNGISGEKSSLSGVVSDIIQSCNECYGLARCCVKLSYSGKLLMQSDIDVMCSKFDLHVKNLSGVLKKSGVFAHQNAIVVVKPCFGACRDDMRFYVNDLLTRLKIGDQEMKKQALVSLTEAVLGDEKYAKICVEIDELIGVLVSFLDSQETYMQEKSLNLVEMIAGVDAYKHVLIEFGIISALIRVLECGSESGKESAARCLLVLTENSDNAWSVSAHGGVTALLKICSRDDYGAELIGLACGVLKNLSGVEEIKRFMVEEGAISTFIKLARSKDEKSQINSIELLQTMAFRDELVRKIVIRDGGIRVLVRVFDPKSSLSSKTREMALKTIDNLCFSSMSTISVLMNYGFLDHLLYFLRHGEVCVQELALKAAFRLCCLSEETKKAMGDAGFMVEFVKLLNAKSNEVREMAAELLHSMVLVSKNRRKFVQGNQNIEILMRLLDPENVSGNNTKLLLSTLLEIANCSSGRRMIANSGIMKNIEKLAENDVSDAKKIVRKLSTNRFRSMISGIWHS